MTMWRAAHPAAMVLCVIYVVLGGCATAPVGPGGVPVEDRTGRAPRVQAPMPPRAVEPETTTIPLEEQTDITRLGTPSETRPLHRPTEPAPAVVAPPRPAPEQDRSAPARDGGIPDAGAASGGPAVVALLDDAGRQAQSGSLDGAAAALERAVRIEPRNASIWSRLAEVRLRQNLAVQAENLAKKSNALAGRDYGLQGRNWRIIAEARRMSGDVAGAQAAQQTASDLAGR
jgi:hypothetical protein